MQCAAHRAALAMEADIVITLPEVHRGRYAITAATIVLSGFKVAAFQVTVVGAQGPAAREQRGNAFCRPRNIAQHLEREFDLVTLWDVFEHVPEPTRLLEALASRLRPGGCIYLHTNHQKTQLLQKLKNSNKTHLNLLDL